jgi:tetratricopeptide (TPR) repeat protein
MNNRNKLVEFFVSRKKTWALTMICLGLIAILLGFLEGMNYAWPMYQHHYDDVSAKSVGNYGFVAYDSGLDSYKQGDYDTALKTLTTGYTQLSDADGNIPASKQRLAADYQLLIGDCLFNQQKIQPAVEAWKQALRHDPNDMPSKYNLELVAQMQSASGGGGSSQGPSSQGGKGRDKGI